MTLNKQKILVSGEIKHRPSDKVVFLAFVPLEELEAPPLVLHFLAQVGLKEPSTKTDLLILDLCLNYLNLG